MASRSQFSNACRKPLGSSLSPAHGALLGTSGLERIYKTPEGMEISQPTPYRPKLAIFLFFITPLEM